MNICLLRRPLFGALVLLSAFNILRADSYTLVDLGLGVAKDINLSGKVVGNADAGGWYYDGTQRQTLKFGTHFFGTSPDQLIFYTAISANAINDAGRIAGSVIFIPLQPQTQTPFYFEGSGPATLLFANGDAYGVNSGGTVVGGSGTGYLFDATKVIDKGSATLNAINDSSLAVGSVISGGLDHAASFDGSNQTTLDLLGLNLPPPGPGHDYESTALSVNNAGRIVGQVQLTGSNPRPTWGFLWKQGSASSLGDLGGVITSPHDINNSGRVVGTATISDDSPHAFVYSDGVISDLNVLTAGAFGWVLKSANAINDDGFIVGEGTKNGVQHAFMLKPVLNNSVPPTINVAPVGSTVRTGNGFNLGVTATGTGPLSYQWRHSGTNVPNATASTYSVAHATANDAGNYRVVVTNPFGSAVSSDAVIQVSDKVTGNASLKLSTFAGLTITGPIGLDIRVEAAEDAANPVWVPVETLTLEVSPYVWVDLNSPQHARRIYRAVPLP